MASCAISKLSTPIPRITRASVTMNALPGCSLRDGLPRAPRPKLYKKVWHPVISLQASSITTASPEADLVEVELKVEGLVCDHCSSRVQATLEGMDFVKDVTVSHESGLAVLHVDAPSYFDAWNQLPSIVDAVKSLGFEAEPYFAEAEGLSNE